MTVLAHELVDIDTIDEALEKRFSEPSGCYSKEHCYCDVTILNHRRETYRMKDKDYMALPFELNW